MNAMLQRLLPSALFLALTPQSGAIAFDRPVPSLLKITPPPLPLGVISFPNGKAINLSVNIAAGAFHPREAGSSLIWTVTARGPVIPCRMAKAVIGLDEKAMCRGDIDADIAPLPAFAPTIYGLDVGADNVAHIVQLVPIKDQKGKPLSGLANDDPDDTVGTYDVMGRALVEEQNGVHPGGIARLADGTFWIGERYAPSLLHVAADGTLIERVVPAGTESDYATVEYPVLGGLPAILAKVDANAEISCITLAPDEKTLFVALKSPSAESEPALQTLEPADQPYVRILAYDLIARTVAAQYAYPLDPPAAFKADNATTRRRQSDVHLVEIMALSGTRFLTVERISRTTRLMIADLAKATSLPTSPLGASGDDAQAQVENMTRATFEASGMTSVAKAQLFDTDIFGEDPAARSFERIESVARMSERELVLITDNAFGIEGERVKMFRLTFPSDSLK